MFETDHLFEELSFFTPGDELKPNCVHGRTEQALLIISCLVSFCGPKKRNANCMNYRCMQNLPAGLAVG